MVLEVFKKSLPMVQNRTDYMSNKYKSQRGPLQYREPRPKQIWVEAEGSRAIAAPKNVKLAVPVKVKWAFRKRASSNG